MILALAALVLITAQGPPTQAQTVGDPARREELALRWAPIHYQDTDVTGGHSLSGRSDYITRVDFDGDWVGRNNWENVGADDADVAAHAYYSVVETSTHWFIMYMFFHPRDWVDHPFFETEHENDAEGVLLNVERDGSTYGVLRSAVTVAHTDFFSYVPDGSTWTSGDEDVDGSLEMEASPHDEHMHPVTAQEAKGHGLKARPDYDINGDGIVYYPSTEADAPEHADDRDVRYKLVDVAEEGGLWAQRDNAELFVSFGTFAGDDAENPNGDTCGDGTFQCSTDAANAPWGWDDSDDIPGRGELATDPAKLVAEYFTIPEDLSRDYTSNLYR